MNTNKSISTYQQYLPAILQEQVFLGRFLLAFEKILSGLYETPSKEQVITAQSENVPGVEEVLEQIHLYFNPQETPEEFLPWLAGWVALSLRDDWDIDVKRAFILEVVKFYRLRGTKEGLSELLSLYLKNAKLGEKVEIFDNFTHFPHYFQVQLTLNDRDPIKYWQQAKIAQAIIEQEKPAQTFYSLKILVPTMQLTVRSEFSHTFKLFEPTEKQTFAIEVKITPSQINSSEINQLTKQLLIQLQGNSQAITLDSHETIIENQSFTLKYTLNYQHFQDNLDGFNVKLSNRTDKDFIGSLTIKLYFQINQEIYSELVTEEQINLSPVLKICSQNKEQEIIEGNTIFQQVNPPQISGMRITEYMWSQPYKFRTFTAPKIQELEPDITAIIDKIELTAIVEVTEPNQVTSDVLNKITVRLKDDVSDFHLFTPETTIENNQIRIKRILYYYQFMQTIDQLTVTLKNLNNVKVVGKVTVQVSWDTNQGQSLHQLLAKDFILEEVPTTNILQICYNHEVGIEITREIIPTILGTNSI
ncbi:phage tail protein [Okeania sp. SIO2B3]|uniref:phage tail protein n=1 Tax=Okeania sp. SIO2B3 TaxID=2607784 RepID=UPI0013C0268B|nr:phage tail protein [Okeania sp. SIO2B3]NET44638.1 phage tail protein [Okeania sp. SIO2B3]